MIVVLGGTSEGRELFRRLEERRIPCVVTVASEYGGFLSGALPTQVRAGRLDAREMEELLKEKQARYLVDATHPFAVEASRNAMEAARQAGITYLRLEREREEIPSHPLVKKIDHLDELKGMVEEGKVVFSTLGSKHLDSLVPMVKKEGGRLVARVLPQSPVLQKCEYLGLNAGEVVAIKGPFSRDLNRELYRQFQAQLVLTKESGSSGGQQNKVNAALDLGLKTVIWCRPRLDYPRVFCRAKDIINYINGGMQG